MILRQHKDRAWTGQWLSLKRRHLLFFFDFMRIAEYRFTRGFRPFGMLFNMIPPVLLDYIRISRRLDVDLYSVR